MPDRFDFLRSEIVEIKLDHEKDTYPVIYIAKFEEAGVRATLLSEKVEARAPDPEAGSRDD
jgi:hypothetical protein